MNDPAVRAQILEVDKPILSGRRIYPAALMRAVKDRVALTHNSFDLIRTVYVFRTQTYLPALNDAARRRHDIIVTVFFVKLRTLDRMILFAAHIHAAIQADHSGSVRLHLANRKP